MSLISRNKEKIISFLRFLDNKPGFRRLFYWIHEIRKDEFKTDRFLAVELDEGFSIGTYKFHRHRMWRMLAESPFEELEVALLKRLVSHFNTFFDIGAHIGFYTCLVRHINPLAKIFSFEPNPENFKSLKKNVEVNKIKGAEIFNIGLGDKKEKRVLYGVDAMGSIVGETYGLNRLPEEQTVVEIDKLDNFVKEVPNGAQVFVKVDIEGNEFSMLRGAMEFISKIKPIGFMMEVCRRWSVSENPNFTATFQLMDELGYHAYAILPGPYLEHVKNPEIFTDVSFLFWRKDQSKPTI